MERSDRCQCQGKSIVRQELEGEELAVTQTKGVTRYRNRDNPTVCIRWVGRHRIRLGEETFFAEESMIVDAGPKLGVSFLVTRCPEAPGTQEERAAGWENVRENMEKIFGCRCLWREDAGKL